MCPHPQYGMHMRCNLYLLMTFAALPFATLGQTSIDVTVTGVRPGNGSLRVGLFDEADFLKTPVMGKIVKASSDAIVVKFENIRDGEYALSVIHDANENGELDKTKLGIPREGFAFSNN